MEKKIDFLKAYEKPISSQKIPQRLLVGGVIGIIFYIILVVGVFFFWLFLKNEYEEISNRIEEKKSQINQMKKKESLYVLLKQRLSTLTKIRSEKKKDFLQFFSFFLQLQEEEINFDQMSASAKGELKVSGRATNASSFAKFLEVLANPEFDKSFSKIILSSLSRDERGGYIFAFSFIYGK